jgi:hypothetical protein
LLGAAQTLVGGITAVAAGVLYDVGGRVLAYSVSSIAMVTLALAAYALAGPEYRARRGSSIIRPTPDPASAVTGHA